MRPLKSSFCHVFSHRKSAAVPGGKGTRRNSREKEGAVDVCGHTSFLCKIGHFPNKTEHCSEQFFIFEIKMCIFMLEAKKVRMLFIEEKCGITFFELKKSAVSISERRA